VFFGEREVTASRNLRSDCPEEHIDSPQSHPPGGRRRSPLRLQIYPVNGASMTTTMELRAHGILPNPRTAQPSTAQQELAAATAASAAVGENRHNLLSAAPQRTEIPERFMRLEPRQPLVVINDDPVFGASDAGRVLGVSAELLKKWRQRGLGPDYIQYGKNGDVRYELSALMAYRAALTVKVGAKA